MINVKEDLYLIVSGMYRSGHHAVMQWITSNILMNTKIIKAGITAHQAFLINYGSLRTGYEKNVYPIDIENFKIDDSLFVKAIHEFDDKQTIKVLVMRDPFNCISSIIKMKQNEKDTNIYENFFTLYKKNIMAITHFDLMINFNRIITDKDYREQIGETLGLEHTCTNWLNYVTKDGGGSSFDKLKYEFEPLSMDIFKRYKYLNLIQLNRILSDDIILEFCKKNFPEIILEVSEHLEQNKLFSYCN